MVPISSLWKSLVEAINSSQEQPTKGTSGPHSHNTERKSWPQMVREEPVQEAVSKAALEHRGVTGDPDAAWPKDDGKGSNVAMGESSFVNDHELGDSRGKLLAEGKLAANRLISTSVPNTSHISGLALSVSQVQHEVEEFDALSHRDLLEDAKFYQDAVVEYQSAYYSIQDRYTHQVHLLEEASRALQAAESHWTSQI